MNEDTVCLKLDERKRTRGDSYIPGIMEIDGINENNAAQESLKQKEVTISDGDFVTSEENLSAKLALQASRSL